MNSTKDIFLSATRDNKTAHLCIHMEQAHQSNGDIPLHMKNAYTKANGLSVVAHKNNIPNLSTTFKSDPTIPFVDLHTRSPSFSAIENQAHLDFLKRSATKAILISGLEAPVCVKKTMDHIRQLIDVTPIMVMDAIDLKTNLEPIDTQKLINLREEAENLWGEDCRTTHVAEVAEWIQELQV